MYERPPASPEAILTDIMRGMAPDDYDDLGINYSTLKKSSNPLDRRELSFKNAIKIDKWCIDQGDGAPLFQLYQDSLHQKDPAHVTFDRMIEQISHAKKESDDVSTMALKLMSGGHLSEMGRKKLLKEVCEAIEGFRELQRTLEDDDYKIGGSG